MFLPLTAIGTIDPADPRAFLAVRAVIRWRKSAALLQFLLNNETPRRSSLMRVVILLRLANANFCASLILGALASLFRVKLWLSDLKALCLYTQFAWTAGLILLIVGGESTISPTLQVPAYISVSVSGAKT